MEKLLIFNVDFEEKYSDKENRILANIIDRVYL